VKDPRQQTVTGIARESRVGEELSENRVGAGVGSKASITLTVPPGCVLSLFI